jgi:hypothetical protein
LEFTDSHRQLVRGEPRLFEDFRLKNSPPERIREITVVESAYDSVLCADFTYVSTPITSGVILYNALQASGLSTLEELRKDKDQFYHQVIQPNIKAAETVALKMLDFGGAVIAPAAFEAKSLGWGQDEYMGLWLDTIERKATRLAMVDGWEYSNGGCEEYLQALLMQAGRRDRNNISIVDAKGEVIPHGVALEKIALAIKTLVKLKFTPTILIRVLHRCVILHDMVSNESDYGVLTDTCGKTHFCISDQYHSAEEDSYTTRYRFRDLRNTLKDLSHLLPSEDSNIVSSLGLSPGLIRNTDRAEITERPARAITKLE